ncbi:dipeptide ABC transporter ATP-binding protein [Microlunatus parietis]|uniref:Peptide/nickel transport system ATP-binding protein n=1 Tax=Microlunatus parietis TaxID=682979 RepID=A0A7Y9I3Q9_9ACTN|nr:ABC transporter ATP-binding protein [Microlunatus parietis]NYE69415.1 peptide/nickel transport system ATP-binding protein [Microlunatus parietis]
MSVPVLDVADLGVTFRPRSGRGAEVEAVAGVSFAVQRGRVLALVGESGSGKSVSALATLGLLPDTARVAGSIRLAGEELLGAPPERLRQVRGGTIGTIFQEPASALNPVYSVGWQITEALRAHDRNLSPADARHRVRELLAQVGLTDGLRIARSYPHELSGGQLQRCMIAMAIGNGPQVLIADEPTTALDVTVQAGILALLRRLRDELGMAILLITHDMGVVADLADDVAVLRSGLLVESAPVRQLFADPGDDYTRTLLGAVPKLAGLTITEAEPAPDPLPDSESDTPPAAELRQVTVTYPGGGFGRAVTAAEQVNLRIGRGDLVGLVGESGSGKSTIGRALAGLVRAAAGSVELAGIDITRANRRVLHRARSRLGMIFQDPGSSLNPRHPIEHSIAEPLQLAGAAPTARRRRVLELLDAVRLGPALAQRLPHELSGGQRQRVAIARALANDPELLIADEPTSALDVSVQQTIIELLADLHRELGFGCLFISHDLAVVGQLTDRIAVMRQGRVVETGPTERVLSRPAEPYTQRLLAAVPVADPDQQRERREAWLQLSGE